MPSQVGEDSAGMGDEQFRLVVTHMETACTFYAYREVNIFSIPANNYVIHSTKKPSADTVNYVIADMITNTIFDGCNTVVGWMALDIRKASLLMRGRKENGIGWDGIREPDGVRCRGWC